eukprot:350665-Chlamydomonas_euryale.AAC.2
MPVGSTRVRNWRRDTRVRRWREIATRTATDDSTVVDTRPAAVGDGWQQLAAVDGGWRRLAAVDNAC